MIKLVFVVPILAPYAVERFKELAKNKKIDLHIIVEKARSDARNGSGWDFQGIKGCNTYLLNAKEYHYNIKNNTGNYFIKESRKFSFRLKKVVNSIAPDIVLVCNSTQIAFLLGPRKYKLGVIVEDTLRAEEGRKRINRIVKKVLLKSADFYIPFSEDAIDFLHSNGIFENFIESSWSMDIDFFSDLSEQKRIEKKIEFGMDERISYVMIANLIPRKGIMQFLEAWKQMPDTFQTQNQVFIIGEGPQKDALEEYIKQNKLENVHIQGGMQYKKVSYYLQCGDIFVLPTLEDLCSLSVLEAMAASKPVLTTIYNGARQFVEEGKNGYIFDSSDKEGIVEVLKKMEHADIKAMSKYSAEKIKMYTTKRVMSKLANDLLEMQ